MTLGALNRLVGTWATEIKHRLMPGEIVHGADTFEWLDGEQFVVWRSTVAHPDFPNAHSIIGFLDEDRIGDDGKVRHDASAQLKLQSYDSRGVYRASDFAIDDTGWSTSRIAEGFSQRSRVTFVGSDTMELVGQLDQGDGWVDDIWISFRRRN